MPVKSVVKNNQSYSVDESFGHLLRRVMQKATANLMERIGEYDITPMQYATLARLYEYGTISQNQLGRLVAIEPGNFHGLINRLMKRNLIERKRDPNDKRRMTLKLTKEGEELIKVLIPLSQDSSDTTLAPLTNRQTEELFTLLGRLL